MTPTRILALVSLCVSALTWTAMGEVTIYRDTFGVPYIYGDTDADAAYGLGYAQAEDRLADLFINVRIATGAMSEVLGKEHLQRDYMMRLAGNGPEAAEYWKTAPAEIREMGDSFVAGVNAYMAKHPEAIPPFALELQGWHTLAIMRAMILNWPLGTLQDEMRQEPNTLGWGSNEWSVAPSRSAEKCAILLSDPHLTWEGMSVFYECHVYGKTISEQHGYCLVGTYGIAYGHSAWVGWAPTTGGTDTSDVYVMKLNPENPLQYEYDGQWRDATMGSISIPVKDSTPEVKPTYWTHLGPALSEPDMKKGVILVGATPYWKDFGLLEQGYQMLLAKDTKEFYAAISENHYMEQNLMYAGRDGHIGYVRAGQTPIRPAGYDWNRPVPGNTSKTAWLGIHPIKDHVQALDPAQGYMQNCNISPQYMMENSPMTQDKYPAYLYNTSWDSRNSRGDRAVQALSVNPSVTKEAAIDLAFDVRDPYWANWKAALEKAVQGVGGERIKDAAFAKAVEKLLSWDGLYLRDNTTAPFVRYWRLTVFDILDPTKINRGEKLTVEEQSALLISVSATVDKMKALYGDTNPAWGDIIKVGRGGKLFPCSGADYGNGENDKRLRTLLSVGVKEIEKEKGVYVAVKGSGDFILMFMQPEGIESYTCNPWGQSSDPNSPHYVDQGEKLWSQRKFKTVYRNKADLVKEATSVEKLSR